MSVCFIGWSSSLITGFFLKGLLWCVLVDLWDPSGIYFSLFSTLKETNLIKKQMVPGDSKGKIESKFKRLNNYINWLKNMFICLCVRNGLSKKRSRLLVFNRGPIFYTFSNAKLVKQNILSELSSCKSKLK